MVEFPRAQLTNTGAVPPVEVRHCPVVPAEVNVNALDAPYPIPPLVKLAPWSVVLAVVVLPIVSAV